MADPVAGPTVRAAVIQMDCVPGDADTNFARAERLVAAAAAQEAELVLLPEFFDTGYAPERWSPLERRVEAARTVETMAGWAQAHRLYLAAAITVPDDRGDAVRDDCVLVDPAGEGQASGKLHLWDAEQRYLEPAAAPAPPLRAGSARLGVAVCYDAGFPEVARTAALHGAEVLLVPAAFGWARRHAWDLLTRSRALENGVFLLAAGRVGTDGERRFAGCSRIVGPRGDVRAELDIDEGVLVVTLCLSEVADARREIPYLRDLRQAAYPPPLRPDPGVRLQPQRGDVLRSEPGDVLPNDPERGKGMR